MKRIKISVLVGTMLVLCAALSMGCVSEKEQTYVQEPTSYRSSEERIEEEFKRGLEYECDVFYYDGGFLINIEGTSKLSEKGIESLTEDLLKGAHIARGEKYKETFISLYDKDIRVSGATYDNGEIYIKVW